MNTLLDAQGSDSFYAPLRLLLGWDCVPNDISRGKGEVRTNRADPLRDAQMDSSSPGEIDTEDALEFRA